MYYHFELEDPDSGEKGHLYIPEEMSIEDFCRELRCEMGLQYTVGSRFHFIIDKQNRVFMQDAEVISTHVDMLWEGGDSDDDPDKTAPKYDEDYYFPEDKHTLQDLFPEVGTDILYAQDYDRIYCKLVEISHDDEEE